MFTQQEQDLHDIYLITHIGFMIYFRLSKQYPCVLIFFILLYFMASPFYYFVFPYVLFYLSLFMFLYISFFFSCFISILFIFNGSYNLCGLHSTHGMLVLMKCLVYFFIYVCFLFHYFFYTVMFGSIHLYLFLKDLKYYLRLLFQKTLLFPLKRRRGLSGSSGIQSTT